MNNQIYNNRRNIILISFLLVTLIAVCIGLYSTNQNSPSDQVNQEPFTEKAFNGMEITKNFPDEVVEEVEEVIEVPVAPEKDLSLAIANAKNFVYTIETDLEQGSGFLFNSKGDIVTNAHVAKDAGYITVTNSNGQQFNGHLIGISDTVDIALIRVPELAGKEPLEMELIKSKPEAAVFALGSPENIANTSSEGKILSVGKNFFDDYQYNNLYEIDAMIKNGSSGGPLIDANTERILGINSIILFDNPKIGYAIPMYTVIDQLKEWAANGKIEIDSEEDYSQHIDEAYLGEDLLISFINSFYELIPYSLNDKKLTYYETYLVPGSQAETEGKKFVKELSGQHRVFDAVKPSISMVKIGETEAKITASATFIYHDQETDEVQTIDHSATYTVVIDEYGDYAIKTIEP